MYKYPYGDSQQLNLDWILAKLKELEASGGSGGADLEEVSNALISLTYNTSTAYRRYDYAFLNGKLYRCLSDTSGVFDPPAWQEALIGDDLSVLTRWINAIDAAAVVDVKFDTSGTNGKIQQKYHDQYHDVVEVDYTPVQNSKRPLSSNAGYELNGAINDITPLDSTPTANSTKGVTSGGVYNALPKEEAVDWFDVNTATVSTNSLFAKRYGKIIVLNGYLTMNGTVAGNGADLGSFSDIAPTATQKISGFGTYNGVFSVISLSFNSNGHISTQTGSGTFTGVIYLPNNAII